MKPNPFQMTLPQAQNAYNLIEARTHDTALDFNDVWITSTIRRYHHYLFIKKQIPHFYLNEAAAQRQISTQICRPSKIDSCLRNTTQDQPQLIDLLILLTDVFNRLAKSPFDQTYYDAMRSLKERINDLKANGNTHNQIAIQAGLSHKTLSDIIKDRESDSHRRHRCPWDLLELLKGAEDKIKDQRDYTSHQQKIMRPGKNGSSPPAPRLPNEYDFIEPGEPCLKCGASWNHLNRNGSDLWGNAVITCITCNKDNLIDLEKILARRNDRRNQLEPNSRCPKCLAPWQNQVREGINSQGRAIYTCNICQSENVLHNRQPTPTGGR